MATFTEEELATRAFLRVARILFEQWEEFGGGDTRLLDWLVDDRFTRVGRSVRGDDYREHLVPRAVIRDLCIQCFERGEPIESAAEVIRKHLKVALISREEASRLNSIPGLRNGMPVGWDAASGDHMIRLRHAGIELRAEEAGAERVDAVKPRGR